MGYGPVMSSQYKHVSMIHYMVMLMLVYLENILFLFWNNYIHVICILYISHILQIPHICKHKNSIWGRQQNHPQKSHEVDLLSFEEAPGRDMKFLLLPSLKLAWFAPKKRMFGRLSPFFFSVWGLFSGVMLVSFRVFLPNRNKRCVGPGRSLPTNLLYGISSYQNTSWRLKSPWLLLRFLVWALLDSKKLMGEYLTILTAAQFWALFPLSKAIFGETFGGEGWR